MASNLEAETMKLIMTTVRDVSAAHVVGNALDVTPILVGKCIHAHNYSDTHIHEHICMHTYQGVQPFCYIIIYIYKHIQKKSGNLCTDSHAFSKLAYRYSVLVCVIA